METDHLSESEFCAKFQDTVRIPKLFYDDHTEGRDLPAPPVVKETKRHYWIPSEHPDIGELLDDALFYWEMGSGQGFDVDCQKTICRSAEWTVKALRQAGAG